MKLGAFIFPTDYSISVIELARAMEERNLDSLFVAEHTHIPSSRLTPYPAGTELPEEYWHLYDPFVALAAAAAVTTHLRLGTGVSLVIEHDPIVLAKQVASLDHLSNGRFLFGVGGGWNREEMANHGTAYETRWSLLRERVEAMKAIWTQDESEYHGKFVDFDPIRSWPKPVQKPHPPVLIGGDGPRTLDRVVRYGDIWLPIPRRGADGLMERMRELAGLAEAAGRTPIPTWAYGVGTKPDRLQSYRALGVAAAIAALPSAPAAEVLPILDRLAEQVEELR